MSNYDYDRNFRTISDNLANKISDVKKLSDERKGAVSQWAYRSGALWSNPQETNVTSMELPKSFGGGSMKHSSSLPARVALSQIKQRGNSNGKGVEIDNVNDDDALPLVSRFGRSGRAALTSSPNRRAQGVGGMVERPASRAEISALEHELEDRVRLVLDDGHFMTAPTATTMSARTANGGNNGDEDEYPTATTAAAAVNEFSRGYAFEPHREAMMITREKMFKEFNADPASLEAEPWLDSFIKCECLKEMCDDVSSKFADVLAVNSLQLGNVLRKLRLTYKQCFEQMHISWKDLRRSYLSTTGELQHKTTTITKLRRELDFKEDELNKIFDSEVQRLNAEFNAEKKRDAEKLLQTEFKMEQMSDTLKYLNGIFKTMQTDGATLKTADLQSRCARLEKENAELLRQNLSLDSAKAQLATAAERVKLLEKEMRGKNEETRALEMEIRRRDEVLSGLMERETVRNAEIEKLQRISKMKDDELVAVDLKDSATSVLCIKCKKSLDDLSNIRSAIMGNGNNNNGSSDNNRVQCFAFRILLPNLRGRRPQRSEQWLRSCMRCILFCKMREDVNLQFIKGQSTPFPAFVYSWFVRSNSDNNNSSGNNNSSSNSRVGAQLTKQLAQADEDRWALYYGVKALCKEDAEAMVFWSLLDETYGDDGAHFTLYCLSVLLSIGGKLLWKQFGSTLALINSINCKPADNAATTAATGNRAEVWLDVETAKQAVRMILVRALGSHISDAMDAIEALKVRPSDLDLKALRRMEEDDTAEEAAAAAASEDEGTDAAAAAAVKRANDGEEEDEEDLKSLDEGTAASAIAAAAATIEGDGSSAAEASATTAAAATAVSRSEDPVTADKFQSLLPQEPTHINLFMWLRLMMQQLHADQIQRAAAIRLMFETASVGALTPQLPDYNRNNNSNNNTSRQYNNNSSSSVFAGAPTHVEYPQFQSICQTLFPNVPVSSFATLYHRCHDSSQSRVNADVFVKFADRFQLFTHALKLPLLPLLRNYSTAILTTGPAPLMTQQATPTTTTAAAASVNVLVAKGLNSTAQSSTIPSATAAAADTQQQLQQQQRDATAAENNKRMYSVRTQQIVRSKLATIVHRKFAAVAPALRFLSQQLPEKWRALVEDAMEAVAVALNDSHLKMQQQPQQQPQQQSRLSRATSTVGGSGKQQQQQQQQQQLAPANNDTSVASLIFLDGLQPFFAYRRLMLLTSLVKALCDNPLLPTELFSAADLENNDINIDLSIYKAERLLSNLEQSLLLAPKHSTLFSSSSGSSSSSGIGRLIDKYHNFEAVRKSLVARRLQNCARKFLGRDVAIPRSVRMCLSAGYMGALGEPTSGRNASQLQKQQQQQNKSPPLLLKSREVYNDPWWGMAQVAETYRFKLTYDMKAASLGLPPISLAQAVAAAQYVLWGSSQLAERAVHDLFVSVRAYRYGVPRLRLFAAFLGDGRELEEPVQQMLSTPHAFAVYICLLLELHRELLAEQQHNIARGREKFSNSSSNNNSSSSGSSELAQLGVEAVAAGKESTAVAAAADDESAALSAENVILVLFPSTENCFKRHDKRDVWSCSSHLLLRVSERWATRQTSLHGNTLLYAELSESLRVNPLGEADVDDFLWLMMQQWAKVASWHVKRSAKAAAAVERSHPVGRYDLSEVLAATAAGSDDAAASNAATAVGTASTNGSNNSNNNSSSENAAIKLASGRSEQRFQLLTAKAANSRLPLLPLSNLRTIVESVYRPGEGGLLADIQHYAAAYVSRIAVRRDNLNIPTTADIFSSTAAAAATAVGSYQQQQQHNNNKKTQKATKFSIEMEKLLRDCVLWDTSEVSAGFRFALQSVVSAALDPATINDISATTAVTATTAATTTATTAAAHRAATAAGAGSKQQQQQQQGSGEFAATAAALLRSSSLQLRATCPEIAVAVARQAFSAHQQPIKAFLSTISLHVERTGDADLERRVQSVRIVMLSLAELFHQLENNNSSSSNSNSSNSGDFYTSYKLYLHECNSSSDCEISEALRSSLQHLQQILPPQQQLQLRQNRERAFAAAREVWSLLQTLLGTVAELAILTQLELPADSWNAGAKVHVDRAFVYSIHTKNNPQA